MAGPCIFCGEKANTHEHAIPGWVAKRFGLKGQFMNELGVIHAPRRKQLLSIASHRARIFCKGCQRHFKDLEDNTVEILEAMGKGRHLTLDRQQQDILARWGAKTPLALIAAERKHDGSHRRDEIPEAHRFPIRWGDIPRHIYVAYGAYADGPVRLTVGTPTLEDDSGNSGRRTYNVVLAFGQVLLKVFSVFEPLESDTFGLPILNGNPVLQQVWPPRFKEVTWPPAHAISGTDAFMFVPLTEPLP